MATNPTTAQPTLFTVSNRQAQIELAWHVALQQLKSGKFSIDLPHNITLAIGEQGLTEILNRYSKYISATGSMVHDAVNDAWRFLPPPYFHGNGAVPASSVESAVAQPPQVTHPPVTMPSLKPRHPAKPHRVPRPMNAFMLYRKDNHATVVANNPGAHNNRISQIIGQMWAAETDQVKDDYRARAQEELRRHMQAHPEYRYTPRKSSDIKRRKSKVKGKGKVSGKFEVSDAPLNFVEPSVLEENARAVDSLVSGPASTKLTHHDVMAMLLQRNDVGWLNMDQSSRADQQAYGAVLDHHELALQAKANADATATLAQETAATQPTVFDTFMDGGFQLNGGTTMSEFDPFNAAAQRNLDLAAEGLLEPFGHFTFPEREANFDLSKLKSTRPY
uniref:MAT1-2-1 n=2 Tax=Diplodia sapinea TaxID=66738 RepID=V5NSV2_9PEZI|nr:MAT1-2-1 [Diplodia sapinea]